MLPEYVPIGSRTKALARHSFPAGYEALHPELEGVNPEDYPDIHKMAILADVAPYSREYHTYRQKVGKQAQGNTELEIEHERILNRVKKTRESVIRMQDRHFTAPVDEISGTFDQVSAAGITLNEYPGRIFQFSSVSTSAADMSARMLGENQVSPSCRATKPSRGRERPAHIHNFGSNGRPAQALSPS